MNLKQKLFMISLAFWFWAFSHYPQLSAGWPMWKAASVLFVAAVAMFFITWVFFRDENPHNPKDFVWYNYPKPLDPFHWPKESGFYFWAVDHRSYFGPYATNAEAEFFFKEHAKAWPKESGETKDHRRTIRY